LFLFETGFGGILFLPVIQATTRESPEKIMMTLKYIGDDGAGRAGNCSKTGIG